MNKGEAQKTPEDALNKYGFLVTSPLGTSMHPFLKSGRDSVVIEKKEGPYKKHDVLLYKRANGNFVLHRVYAIDSSGGKAVYTMVGDAQTSLEYGVRDDMILGVLTGIYRNGKYKSLNTVFYNIYKTHSFALFQKTFILLSQSVY